MTTATVAVACGINHTDDWVQVVSPTGTALRVYCLRSAKGYAVFAQDERDLLMKLIKASRKGEARVTLTYAEMATFKRAGDRVGTEPTQAVKAAEEAYREHVAHKAAFAVQEAKQEAAAYEAEYRREVASYGIPETHRDDEADDMDQYAEQDEHPRRFVTYTSKAGRVARYLVVEEYTDTIQYGFRKGQKVKCLMIKPTAWVGDAFGVLASKCVPCQN